MTIGDTSAEAVVLFDKFVQASTCQSILAVFQQLCDLLDIHPLEEAWFYQTLKCELCELANAGYCITNLYYISA